MIKIRRMINSDIDAVYNIETSVHIAPWSRDILRDCVAVGYDCRILEIVRDNKMMIAGYIIIRHAANRAHILNICIAKSLQSQGYGRQFLKEVLNSLEKNTALTQAILEVRPSNLHAVRLYQSLGFVQTEIKLAYYKDGDKTEDAILLKKLLNSNKP